MSSRMVGTAAPVSNVFPHAQVTTHFTYLGWIPSFIRSLLAEGRAGKAPQTPEKAAHLRITSLKIKRYKGRSGEARGPGEAWPSAKRPQCGHGSVLGAHGNRGGTARGLPRSGRAASRSSAHPLEEPLQRLPVGLGRGGRKRNGGAGLAALQERGKRGAGLRAQRRKTLRERQDERRGLRIGRSGLRRSGRRGV